MKQKKKGPKIILLIASVIIICLLCSLAALVIAEKTVPEPDPYRADAIVVLGAQVYPDGTLSLQLQTRLEAALEAWNKSHCTIIVCGGQGAKEPLSEAEAMKKWLTEQSVPEEDILTDDRSVNTQQNLDNAKALLPEGVNSVLIVTSDYHLPRALRIADDLRLEAYGIGSPTLPQFWLKNHFREVLAWGKYFLKKVF